MDEVYQILKEIAETSSVKKKKEILKAHADNELLLEILKFCFSPMIITGINKAKLHKKLNVELPMLE